MPHWTALTSPVNRTPWPPAWGVGGPHPAPPPPQSPTSTLSWTWRCSLTAASVCCTPKIPRKRTQPRSQRPSQSLILYIHIHVQCFIPERKLIFFYFMKTYWHTKDQMEVGFILSITISREFKDNISGTTPHYIHFDLKYTHNIYSKFIYKNNWFLRQQKRERTPDPLLSPSSKKKGKKIEMTSTPMSAPGKKPQGSQHAQQIEDTVFFLPSIDLKVRSEGSGCKSEIHCVKISSD